MDQTRLKHSAKPYLNYPKQTLIPWPLLYIIWIGKLFRQACEEGIELTSFCHRIQRSHTENLMTTKNLAMVFGPTLMRDQDASRDLVDMGLRNATIEYLITHVYDLF